MPDRHINLPKCRYRHGIKKRRQTASRYQQLPKTQAGLQLVPERTVGTIWGVKMDYTKVQPEGNLREGRPVTDVEHVCVYGRIYSPRCGVQDVSPGTWDENKQ